MAEVRSVAYHVGATPILHRISTHFRPRRFNIILGPNGAGKSTLLKIATGLVRPTTGEVLYDGEAVTAFTAAALARKRAVLSQRVELAFALPAQSVVMMGRYPHYAGAPAAKDKDIVERALKLVGMHEKRQQSYPTLSGGEQQKVQLARVLAQLWNYDESREHKFLFLDEPTAGLDIHYQIHILDTVSELLSYDCTVVAILHDLNTALQYGDSFFMLAGGRLIHEAERAEDVHQQLIERVFDVRAHRIVDANNARSLWQFSL